jgi:hypothetical protein
MNYRYTRHQVPRRALPDAEDGNRLFLFKNVSRLTATYQIRLLAYQASEAKKRLLIRVPKICDVQSPLKRLIKETGRTINVEKI